MSSYIPLTCSHCGRTLKVRSAYVGHWISCNHCNHAFLAADPTTGSEAAQPEPVATAIAPDEDASTRQADWVKSLEEQLEIAWEENSRLVMTVEVLKAELCERVSEVERLGRSAEDLLTVRAERDLCEVERRALAALAERLRTRLEEVEQSHAESEARHEAVRREQEQQLEEALRSWENKRRQLIAHGEEELRSTREGISQLATGVDSLQSELANVRADRDAALEHNGRLRQERDRLAQRQGESDQTLDESASELRQAQQQLSLALERETEVNERLGAVQAELQIVRQELDHERQSHMEETTALVQELEALFQDQLTSEHQRAAEAQEARQCEIDALARPWHDALEQSDPLDGERVRFAAGVGAGQTGFQAPAADESLRQEITALQDTLELLKGQRDDANEHAGTLRLERDQLRDSFARLEARLNELEESQRIQDDDDPGEVVQAPPQAVAVIARPAEVVQAGPAFAADMEKLPEAVPANADFPPTEPLALPDETSELLIPDVAEPAAQPPAVDSVEHRIRSLREHLREDGGATGKKHRRLLGRLGRILRSSDA